MKRPAAPERDRLKRLAAEAAVAEIEHGMVLVLGSRSTAALMIEALATRIAGEGLRVVGISTSERTTALARRLGVPLTSFAEHRRIDLTIDGADEVEIGTLNLIKVVVDESKLVDRLGARSPLPVEVASFVWELTADRLAAAGAAPRLRMAGDEPFRTDGGNLILDCAVGRIADPAAPERRLAAIVGVMEIGLFVGIATHAVVGTATGVNTLFPTGRHRCASVRC